MTATALNHSFVPWRCSARGPFCRLPISRLILHVHTMQHRLGGVGRGTISFEEIFSFFFFQLPFYPRRSLSLARTVTNFVVPTICTLRNFHSMQDRRGFCISYRDRRRFNVFLEDEYYEQSIDVHAFVRNFKNVFRNFSLRKNFKNISREREREIPPQMDI